jgi:hypothetical protein
MEHVDVRVACSGRELHEAASREESTIENHQAHACTLEGESLIWRRALAMDARGQRLARTFFERGVISADEFRSDALQTARHCGIVTVESPTDWVGFFRGNTEYDPT